jgi:Rod binding domain-containing protein
MSASVVANSPAVATSAKTAPTDPRAALKQKARAAAEDFEAMFINSMMQQMFTGIEGEGPFGGDGATGVWRSFLTNEYSKSIAKSGGFGIANHVYSSLIAEQEAQAPNSKPGVTHAGSL